MTEKITSEALLFAVGGIDDDIIHEASEAEITKTFARDRTLRRRQVMFFAAACLVLTIATVMIKILPGLGGAGMDVNGGNAHADTFVETGGQTTDALNGALLSDDTYTEKYYGVGSRLIFAGGNIKLSYVGYRPGGITLKLEITSVPANSIELGFYATSESGAVTVAATVSDTGCDGAIKMTVDGVSADKLPKDPGIYDIDIDHSKLGSSSDAGGSAHFAVSWGDGCRARVCLIEQVGAELVIGKDTVIRSPESFTTEVFSDIEIISDVEY